MTRLNAPSGDGELLQAPPLAEVPALARLANECFAGTDWAAIRAEARREVLALLGPVGQASLPALVKSRLEACSTGTTPVGRASLPALSGPWFLAGHQPELFHPGVWVKSFALAGLARSSGGFALNLVVDNDTIKSTAVRVPVRGDWPVLESVPFDRWQGEAPWEERHVADEALFASFGERIAERMRPWGVEPLAVKLWPEVLKQQGPIGARFAAARRAIEREWGCDNVEVPLSRLCQTQAFGRFVMMLMEDLPRFVAVHNAAVAAYRRANGIKSASHPVPDLAADGGRLEMPLWTWKAGDTRRERVFARPEGANVKLRSRALATTLFARLFLADVFLHGIGGGKYDELADAIIRGYFGVEPPPFAVLSATCRLPLPAYPSTCDDVRRLAMKAREMEWNPQRWLPPHPADAERRALLASPPATRRARREWFARLRGLLEPMRQRLPAPRQEAAARLARARREADANALLRRRDYSFVLFPEATLRGLFSRTSGSKA